MAMTMLNKELVAVAISVAAGCRPCTTYHLAAARRAQASDAAIGEAVAVAVRVRTSATEGMRRHALGLEPAQDGCDSASAGTLDELIALGASLAVNCTSNIDRHLAAARALGLPQDDLDAVRTLVQTIRSKAIGHAEARFSAEQAAPAKCC